MNRREFITRLAPPDPLEALWRKHYTNVWLTTHEGRRVRFYEQLIRGKIALINFMYATCQGICPLATSNLAKVQRALQARVGRDIFFYSLSLKPEQDDPGVLRQFAEMHGAQSPGWLFLTGDPDDLETLRFRLFGMENPKIDESIEQHTGMIHLVNDVLKRTCKVPALATPRQILQSLSWMEPTTSRSPRTENRLAG